MEQYLDKAAKAKLKELGYSNSQIAIVEEKYLRQPQRFGQEGPLGKGIFLKLAKKNNFQAHKWVRHVHTLIINRIKQEIKRSSGEEREAWELLLKYESFQVNQKGETWPINWDDAENVINDIIDQTAKKADKSTPYGRKLLEYGIKQNSEFYKKYGLVNSIKWNIFEHFASWYREAFPSNTTRGFKFNKRGSYVWYYQLNGTKYTPMQYKKLKKGKTKDVVEKMDKVAIPVTTDILITQSLPKSFKELIEQAETLLAVVSTLGWRFQASKGLASNEVKVRMINIPDVIFQLLVGITSDAYQVEIQKRFIPAYEGWFDPTIRVKMNNQRRETAVKSGYLILPLDFSKYDRNLPLWLQIATYSHMIYECLDGSKSNKERYLNAITRVWSNRYLLYPKAKTVTGLGLVKVLTLLSSGDKITQSDGSELNRVIMFALAKHFKYKLPIELISHLGDDSLWAVPVKVVNSFGSLQVFYKEVEKVIAELGMVANADKQWQDENSYIFLQRLTSYSGLVNYEASASRLLWSKVVPEKTRQTIQGVKSHNALERIGQISTDHEIDMNQGTVTTKQIYYEIVIPEWLKLDSALVALAQESKRQTKTNKEAAVLLFKELVNYAGGAESVIRGLYLGSYDPENLSKVLRHDGISETFPVLEKIVEIATKMAPIDKEVYQEAFKE